MVWGHYFAVLLLFLAPGVAWTPWRLPGPPDAHNAFNPHLWFENVTSNLENLLSVGRISPQCVLVPYCGESSISRYFLSNLDNLLSDLKGSLWVPKWMNFGKSFKRPLNPCLIFGRIYWIFVGTCVGISAFCHPNIFSICWQICNLVFYEQI